MNGGERESAALLRNRSVTWFANDVTKYAFKFSLCGSYVWNADSLAAILAIEWAR